MFRLRYIRESKNISRYQLAKISGVKDSTIQMIENSENPNPTFKIMCKLADALEVSLDDLRGGDKDGLEYDKAKAEEKA